MNVQNRCLFGGALFNAGVAMTATADPSFVITDDSSGMVAYVMNNETGESDHEESFNGALSLVGAAINGATANAELSTTLIMSSVDTGSGNNYALAYAYTDFTVSENVDVRLTWDHSGLSLTEGSYALAYLENEFTEEELFFTRTTDDGTTAGSLVFSLSAGVVYSCTVSEFAAHGGEASFVRLEIVPTCPGDIDGSGGVDLGDLNLVLGNFGGVGEPGIPGDANGDGLVDLGDLNLVLGNFGGGCG